MLASADSSNNAKFFKPWADITKGKNHLPHWEQPGATYFLTFRLADSLPKELLDRWGEEREVWLKLHPPPWSAEVEQEYHLRFSNELERMLDDGHGACLLRQEMVRLQVATVSTKFDQDRYFHHAWVNMPNHAHLLVSIQEQIRLADLLKAWKGASSRAIGLMLNRSMTEDPFWQKDYFDQLGRDESHFWNCARYIQRNPFKTPLKAGEYSLHLSQHTQAMFDI